MEISAENQSWFDYCSDYDHRVMIAETADDISDLVHELRSVADDIGGQVAYSARLAADAFAEALRQLNSFAAYDKRARVLMEKYDLTPPTVADLMYEEALRDGELYHP